MGQIRFQETQKVTKILRIQSYWCYVYIPDVVMETELFAIHPVQQLFHNHYFLSETNTVSLKGSPTTCFTNMTINHC